jgi:hypothetical protein
MTAETALSLEARVALARGWRTDSVAWWRHENWRTDPTCQDGGGPEADCRLTWHKYHSDSPPPITAKVVVEMQKEMLGSGAFVFRVLHGRLGDKHWCQAEMLRTTLEGEGDTFEAAVAEVWLAFKEVGA